MLQFDFDFVFDWHITHLRVSLVLQVEQAKQLTHQALLRADTTDKNRRKKKSRDTLRLLQINVWLKLNGLDLVWNLISFITGGPHREICTQLTDPKNTELHKRESLGKSDPVSTDVIKAA